MEPTLAEGMFVDYGSVSSSENCYVMCTERFFFYLYLFQFKEEKDLPPDVAPPVVSNMVMPALPKTEFLDFNEYHETMYPLLMLELWNGVSKEYNRMNDAR